MVLIAFVSISFNNNNNIKISCTSSPQTLHNSQTITSNIFSSSKTSSSNSNYSNDILENIVINCKNLSIINTGKLGPLKDNAYFYCGRNYCKHLFFECNNYSILNYANDDTNLSTPNELGDFYYNTQVNENEIIEKFLETDNLNIVYAKDYYDSSSTYYSSLMDTDIVLLYKGEYDYSQNKILYINYEDDTREPEKVWTDFFEERINGLKGKTDTPVVIKCSYTFYINGHRYDYVVASNVYKTTYKPNIDNNVWNDLEEDGWYKSLAECSVEPVVPYGDNHVIYRCEYIFIDGKPAKSGVTRCSTINEEFSFSPSKEDEYIHLLYYSYQKDSDGNLIICPVFLDFGYSISYAVKFGLNNRIFLGDTNNDGQTDITVIGNEGISIPGYPHTYMIDSVTGNLK